MKKAVAQGLLQVTQKVADDRWACVAAIVEGLPEGGTVAAGNHLSLAVRQKRIGWYLENHHGDGRLAVNCKAARGVAQQLEQHASARFHIPKYMGHRGWVGLWLDTSQVDWAEVEAILINAYRLTATNQLLAKLDAEQHS